MTRHTDCLARAELCKFQCHSHDDGIAYMKHKYQNRTLHRSLYIFCCNSRNEEEEEEDDEGAMDSHGKAVTQSMPLHRVS